MDEKGPNIRRRAAWTILALAVVLSACAAGPNPAVGIAAESGGVAGFWMGIWHGIITPITFIISLFSDGVNVYEVHNSGNLYNLGFVIGAVFLIGGSHSARSAKR